MLKRFLAVSVLGLAVGLSACGKSGNEEAKKPAKQGTEQQQETKPAPAPEQGAPSTPSAPPSTGTEGGGSQNP
ncbi:MAG: hypothetical protein M0006_12995 [Magnetospirillum sp.]|nr:hypothetical protein [Magnetospirillum sp.]